MSDKQLTHNMGDHMANKSDKKKSEPMVFQNVGLLKEDHDLLRKLADAEQRSMARQLSVLIRKAVDELNIA
jgi:ferredoxin-fold anticodon binding domain-containing protein